MERLCALGARLRRWLDASYRNRLLAALIGAGSGVVLVLATAAFLTMAAITLGQIDDDAEFIRDIATADVQGRLNRMVANLNALARDPLVVNALTDTEERSAYLAPALRRVQGGPDGLALLALLDHRGRVLGHAVDASDDPAHAEEIWHTGNDGGTATGFGVASLRARHQPPAFGMLIPVIYPPTGSIEGYLVGEALIGEALLPKTALRGFRLSIAPGRPAAEEGSLGPFTYGARRYGSARLPFAGDLPEFTVSVAPLPSLFWEPFVKLAAVFASNAALLLFLVVIVARRLADSLARPLLELTRAVAFQQNNPASTRLAPMKDGPAEIRDLSESFSALVGLLGHRANESMTESRRRENQLSAVLNMSADGFAVFGSEGNVEYVNPAFETLTGIDYIRSVGKTVASVLDALRANADPGWRWPPELRPGPPSTAPADPPDAAGAARLAGDGSLLRLLAPQPRFLMPTVWRSERWRGTTVLNLRDVTRETELDRMKSQFLSTAAHELRTPLASISGFAQLLREVPSEDPVVVESTGQIVEQCASLTLMLDDLLDLERMEARATDVFVFEETTVTALVASIGAAFRPPAGRDPVAIPEQLPHVVVRVDERRIRQALNNLLSNAYKYSPAGGPVRIEIGVRAQMVGLRVADAGMGMTATETRHAFERFWRADPSGALPGTGLGLSIVKEIVDRHEGRVELASEPGKGTAVTLWLPRADRPAPP